jgi:hypothetical protein
MDEYYEMSSDLEDEANSDPPLTQLVNNETAPSNGKKSNPVPNNESREPQKVLNRKQESATPSKTNKVKKYFGEGKTVGRIDLQDKNNEPLPLNIYCFNNPENGANIYAILESDFRSILRQPPRSSAGYITQNNFEGIAEFIIDKKKPDTIGRMKNSFISVTAAHRNLTQKLSRTDIETTAMNEIQKYCAKKFEIVFDDEKKKKNPQKMPSDYGDNSTKEFQTLLSNHGLPINEFDEGNSDSEESEEDEEDSEEEDSEELSDGSQAEEADEEESREIMREYQHFDRTRNRKRKADSTSDDIDNIRFAQMSAKRLCTPEQKAELNASYKEYLALLYRSIADAHLHDAQKIRSRQNGETNASKK